MITLHFQQAPTKEVLERWAKLLGVPVEEIRIITKPKKERPQ